MARVIEVKPGDKYGRLTVVREEAQHRKPSGGMLRMIGVVCECGTYKICELYHLRTGHTNSCGCYMKERAGKSGLTHGKSNHPLYWIHTSMMSRCYNSKDAGYDLYGGRGIEVCDEWRTDKTAFFAWAESNGYARHLQLDRADNNGNYEPSNCRFVEPKINCRNRRCTKLSESAAAEIRVRRLAGESGPDLAKAYNVSKQTIYAVSNMRTWL